MRLGERRLWPFLVRQVALASRVDLPSGSRRLTLVVNDQHALLYLVENLTVPFAKELQLSENKAHGRDNPMAEQHEGCQRQHVKEEKQEGVVQVGAVDKCLG